MVYAQGVDPHVLEIITLAANSTPRLTVSFTIMDVAAGTTHTNSSYPTLMRGGTDNA